jgi:hypothetical protein
MSERSGFLVETYAPQTEAGIRQAEARARDAARALRLSGLDIDYRGAIAIPGDELVFHFFEATDGAIVTEACRRAGIQRDRMVPISGSISPPVGQPVEADRP